MNKLFTLALVTTKFAECSNREINKSKQQIIMRKILLMMVAMMLTNVSVWANEVTKLDKVPYETYMKNISFDTKTKKITFEDTYQQGTPMARKYTICFASNDPVAVAGSPELEYSFFKDYGNYYFGIVGCNQYKCTANSTATIADST